jgi:hypothetical protein
MSLFQIQPYCIVVIFLITLLNSAIFMYISQDVSHIKESMFNKYSSDIGNSRSLAHQKTLISMIDRQISDNPISIILAGTCSEIPMIFNWVKQNEQFMSQMNGDVYAIISGSSNCLMPTHDVITFHQLRLDKQFDNHDCGSLFMIKKAFEILRTPWFLYVENDLIILDQMTAALRLKQLIVGKSSCYVIGGQNHWSVELPEDIKYHINGKSLYNKKFMKVLNQMNPITTADCEPYDVWSYRIVSKDKSLWRHYCRDRLFINTKSDLSHLLSNSEENLIVT